MAQALLLRQLALAVQLGGRREFTAAEARTALGDDQDGAVWRSLVTESGRRTFTLFFLRTFHTESGGQANDPGVPSLGEWLGVISW